MRLIGWIPCVALALMSCQKTTKTTTDADDSPAEENPKPTILAAPTPAPKPAPVVAATPKPVVAPVKTLAPAGRFYLRRKISIETDDGIAGVLPGTALEQTGQGQYRTPDGKTIAVADADVTNVLEEARQIIGHDRAAQAAIATRDAVAAGPGRNSNSLSGKSGMQSQNSQDTGSSTTEPGEARFVEGVNTQKSGLQSSTALGAGHTRTKGGVLWQKSPDGKVWVAVKWLKERDYALPPDEMVR